MTIENIINILINILIVILKRDEKDVALSKKVHIMIGSKDTLGRKDHCLDLDSARLASSVVDGKSSTYLDPIVILSLHIALLASSAEVNSTYASPVAFPSGRHAI